MSVYDDTDDEFQEGDIVTLASGGTPMTVLSSKDGQVDLIWNAKGEMKYRTLSETILVLREELPAPVIGDQA